MRSKSLFPLFVVAALVLVSLACSISAESPTATPAPTATSAPTAAPTSAPTAAPTTAPTAAPTKALATAPAATKAAQTTPAVGGPTKSLATAEPTRVTPVPDKATKTAMPTEKAQAGLTIVNSSAYADDYGDYHVVGELKNGQTKALTNMEITITIKDKAGKSLLSDSSGKAVDSEVFEPLLTTLGPGESSPFEYTLSEKAAQVAKYEVVVTGQNTATVKRPKVTYEHTQAVASNDGGFFISGEIINQSTAPVTIYGLAGAMLDNDKKVVSAAYSTDYVGYLSPTGDSKQRDRTPFIIYVQNPGTNPENWKTYMDANEVSAADNFTVNLDITNRYFDENDEFHVVGNLSNKSNEILRVYLVAGLYDADGVVLDAYSQSSPTNLAPNETIPYDLSYFANVNYNPDEAARLDHFTVQSDPNNTFKSSIESFAIKTSGDKLTKSGATWTISGQLKNTSAKPLTMFNVIASLVDKTGKVMAANHNTIYPTGSNAKIAVGETVNYSVEISIDPAADTTGWTFKTFAKGDAN